MVAQNGAKICALYLCALWYCVTNAGNYYRIEPNRIYDADNREQTDFFIIDTFKGGTTSLHQYLSQHPDIFMPGLKETRYFAFVECASCSDGQYLDEIQYPIRTQEQYLSLLEAADSQQAIGEESPIYLDSPRVAKKPRIAENRSEMASSR